MSDYADKNEYGPAEPKPFCVLILIIINALIFLYTDWFPDGDSLIDHGAIGYVEVFQNHEYYRFLTSMFLHADIDHIFNNMLTLFFLGYFVEKHLGHFPFLFLYFSSGILAGYTSIVYNYTRNSTITSIGASGAVFGIMGAMICVALMFRKKDPRIAVNNIALMVFVSVYAGYKTVGVDNMAHVGGLLSGIFLCWLVVGHLRRKGVFS